MIYGNNPAYITYVCAGAGERTVLPMKKFGSRLLGLLIAAALVLGACSTGALAAGNTAALPAEVEIERTNDGEGGYEAMAENREELGGGTPFVNEAQVFSAPPAVYDGGDLYSQLTTRQKACYDALEKITIDQLLTAAPVEFQGKKYSRVLTQVSGITGAAMSGSFSGGKFKPTASGADVESGIYTDLCAAIVALRYDRPDILWMGVMRYGYKVSQSGSSAAKVTNVMFDFYLEYGGREKTMYSDMMASAKEIADQAGQAADTYGKVKTVHDVLVQGSVYGDPDEDLAHTAYSALIFEDRYEPVCDGYAKAFKIVCGLLDIPCAMPSSRNHMWNNVKMDDGDWYNVDLTWDDDGAEEICYDYFLIGSQTVVDGEAFSKQEDHIEENPYDPYRAEDADGVLKPVALRFPTKNKTAYEYQGADYPPLTFPDVKRSAWYYEAIESAAQMGLFKGDTSGLFLPDDKITRAQFALVMANSMGVDLTPYTAASFTDVPAGRWFSAAAAWAKETKLMVGYKDGSFHPDSPITRQEMCVVLYNAMEVHQEMDPSVASVFLDNAKIAGWAKDAVYQCYTRGLVQGDEKDNFSPTGSTLRSHAAVVFTKFAALEQETPQE